MSVIKQFKKELGGSNIKSSGSIVQLLGSYSCKLDNRNIKLYVMHIGRMNDCAIVICNIPSLDENSQFALTSFSKEGHENGTTHYYPLIFTPADFGIKLKTDLLELVGFAKWCHDIGVNHIYINGHFGQQGCEIDGRGFIRGNDKIEIDTMDICQARKHPFLKKSLNFINMLSQCNN